MCGDFLLALGEALGLASDKTPSESDATSALAKLPRLDPNGELVKLLPRLGKVQDLLDLGLEGDFRSAFGDCGGLLPVFAAVAVEPVVDVILASLSLGFCGSEPHSSLSDVIRFTCGPVLIDFTSGFGDCGGFLAVSIIIAVAPVVDVMFELLPLGFSGSEAPSSWSNVGLFN